jgi:hypothetical protein
VVAAWHGAFEHLEEGMLAAEPHVLESRAARPNLIKLVNKDDVPSGDI